MNNQEKLSQLIRDKREEIIALAAKHGAYNVRVFGSVARGEATENSDLDFLIDYDLEKVSSWFPVGLKLDLEELLGVSVDIGAAKSLKESIKDRVLSEAIKLWEGKMKTTGETNQDRSL